jgi:hypothetical protein
MPRRDLRPAGEMFVRYTAEEMPSDAIVRVQRDTVRDLNAGDVDPKDAARILDLLLTVALQKIKALA